MRQRNEGQDGGQRRQYHRPRTLNCGFHHCPERVQPFVFVVLDLPDQDQRVAHQDARQRNQTRRGVNAERLPEQNEHWHHANQAEGLVRNTITIAGMERTWKMRISNVTASMIGKSGSMAFVAFPDSSIEPACSMR